MDFYLCFWFSHHLPTYFFKIGNRHHRFRNNCICNFSLFSFWQPTKSVNFVGIEQGSWLDSIFSDFINNSEFPLHYFHNYKWTWTSDTNSRHLPTQIFIGFGKLIFLFILPFKKENVRNRNKWFVNDVNSLSKVERWTDIRVFMFHDGILQIVLH